MKAFQLLGDPKKFWWFTLYMILFGKRVLRACGCSSNWGTGAFFQLEMQWVYPIDSEDLFPWTCPICLCFLPFPLFSIFYFPVPFLCHVLPFPSLHKARGRDEAQAEPAAVAWGMLPLCHPSLHAAKTSAGWRDTAWLDIYSCCMRKPDLVEELGGSVGLSWVRNCESGNGKKASFSQ